MYYSIKDLCYVMLLWRYVDPKMFKWNMNFYHFWILGYISQMPSCIPVYEAFALQIGQCCAELVRVQDERGQV